MHTCQGHLPNELLFPPTILPSGKKRLPHTASINIVEFMPFNKFACLTAAAMLVNKATRWYIAYICSYVDRTGWTGTIFSLFLRRFFGQFISWFLMTDALSLHLIIVLCRFLGNGDFHIAKFLDWCSCIWWLVKSNYWLDNNQFGKANDYIWDLKSRLQTKNKMAKSAILNGEFPSWKAK